VRRLPIVVPALEGERPPRGLSVALNAYDLLAFERSGCPERHRTISGEEVVELVPALAARAPSSGYLYHDCQVDDARLVLTVLDEAERRGAVCANRVEAVELLERNGNLAGVGARDAESGKRITIAAERVVNATGVWADRIFGGRAGHPKALRPSRGTHIIVRREDLPLDRAGVVVPAGQGRHISVLPWLDQVLVGATDDDDDRAIDDLRPRAEDVDYLLAAVNTSFGTTLGRDDVAGAFAGARPLVAGRRRRRSVDLSRRAELRETSDGLITITGGKLTTWRRMAKLAVDRVVARDGRRAPCRTHEIALGEPQDPCGLPRIEELPEQTYEHLAARYGRRAVEVLSIAAARRQAAEPIVAGHPDLLAEAVFAALREQARTVGDVLLRRTRIGVLAARDACDSLGATASRVANAMAPELGWDAAREANQVAAWAGEARAEGIVVSASELPSKLPERVR
jgi:glycerol-3-phosphate dehydrogenase